MVSIRNISVSEVIQADVAELQISEQSNLALIKWLRHPSSEEFKHHSLLLVELLLEYECRYLLSNAQAIHYLEFGDQNWIIQKWIPLVHATALERQAIVVSQLSHELMDADRILEENTRQASTPETTITIQTRLFLDAFFAQAWLLDEASG